MVLHELAYRHPAPPIHQTQPHLQTSSTSHPSNAATPTDIQHLPSIKRSHTYRHPAPPIHQTQPHLQTSSTSHPSNAATIKPDRLHPTTDSVIHLSEDTTKESMLIIPKEFSTDTVQGSCLWSQLNTAICPATEFTATSAHRRVAVTVHCTEAGCCHSPLHTDRLLSQSTAHMMLSQSTAQTGCCHSPLQTDRLLSQSTADRQVAVTGPPHTDRLLSQSTANRQVAVTGPPHTDRLPSQSTAHRQDAVAVILQPCTQCTACKVEVLQQTTWWLYYGRCPAQHTHPHQPTSTALHSKETLTASDKLTHTCIILYYAPLKVFLFLPSPQFCFHHRPPDTGGNSHPVSLLD